MFRTEDMWKIKNELTFGSFIFQKNFIFINSLANK